MGVSSSGLDWHAMGLACACRARERRLLPAEATPMAGRACAKSVGATDLQIRPDFVHNLTGDPSYAETEKSLPAELDPCLGQDDD